MDPKLLIILQITIGLLVLVGLVSLIIFWVRRRSDLNRSVDFVFLQVLIPKKESKEDQEKERDMTGEIRKVTGVGEHFLTTLFGIYDGGFMTKFNKEDFLSFEFIATKSQIKFFIGVPKPIANLVEKQITSFYPESVVEETDMPAFFEEKTHQAVGYLSASKPFEYPFKTYQKFESADPMNNILNAMAQASDEYGNAAAVQLMIRPVGDDWQQDVRDAAAEISNPKSKTNWWNPFSLLGTIFKTIVYGPEDDAGDGGSNDKEESNPSQELTQAMNEKAENHGFETIIRIVASSPEKRNAQANVKNISNAFAQYGSPSLNSFTGKNANEKSLIRNFLLRRFARSWHLQNKMILSTTELGSIFHFPHVKYNNIPAVKWQNYKIVRAPSNAPTKGLLLGHNLYRGTKLPIYMKREDRFRHFYVIGQTGTGKSSIFQTMIRQDLANGDGICVVDPHGSLIEDLLPFVPRERADDVIIFDPSDLERPMGLNLLEAETPEEQDMVALDAMNLMIKMFDEEVFGPRIQDYFRNGVLTLMADPDGGAMTDIVRLFTDDAYQKTKIKHVTNPVVKSFWTNQMAKTGAREKGEMIPYFAAKFGQFVTNGMLRNIIGQTQSAFKFDEVMDQKKILFMNLSKGVTGEINSKLLGLIIVSKIQVAALRRQQNMMSGQKLVDFFLYIDEFQNYVTDSIESILSEARKYRLSINIAHQYIAQIDTTGQKKGVNLKDAVFGNVGTMMCYKIGAQDAEFMAKEMHPSFSDQDLINVDTFKGAIKLSIDGQPSKPFSIDVPRPWHEKGDEEISDILKQISRLTYGRDKKFVEKEIFARLAV